MKAKEITTEEVEASQAKLVEAKKHREYRKQAVETAELRRAWREQEVAAGRRSPGAAAVTTEER